MKKRYWLLVAFIAVLMTITFGLLIPAGFFKSIDPHFSGKKVAMYTSMHGTEDLDVDHKNGLLFISSTNRRAQEADIKDNGIYVLDLDDSSAQPYKIPSNYSSSMRPHGISLFQQDSSSYIYVINHRVDGDFIELYAYMNDSLLIIESFNDPQMISPNDIHGISTSEFYITNDHSSSDPGQSQKEDYLRLNNRNIIHYKDGVYREAANRMAMPNGINGSTDGQLLYATTTLGQEFITYDRDVQTGTLTELRRQDLGSGLDNIDVDTDGDIWIGSHPKLLTFVSHAGDANKISPSQIFKLSPTDETGTYKVKEIYLDDGSTISASSIAVKYKDDLLIGAVFDQKVYRGRMNYTDNY